MIHMTHRISRLEKDQVDPESRKIYDVFLQERGNVPNMFRTAAHRPEIFRTMIAHFRAIMNTGTVPAKLKELAIVRTSQINSCQY
jgi:alkylhydroperoxidase family enzyme